MSRFIRSPIAAGFPDNPNVWIFGYLGGGARPGRVNPSAQMQRLLV
jgi:hypothetical protein